MEDLKIITLNRESLFLLNPRSINTKARVVCKVWHVNKGDGSIFPKLSARKIEPSPLFLALYFCLSLPALIFAAPIKINNDSQYTNSTTVTLNLSLQDIPNGNNVSQMSLSNNNSIWSTPESYSPTKSWNLSPQGNVTGSGKVDIGDASLPVTQAQRTVYVKFKDASGNWSDVYSAAIILDTQGHSLEIASPQEGQVIKE